MPALPRTTRRVRRHTAADVNRRIAERTARSVAQLAASPERIEERLRELDAEWDVERVLEANAATLALTGTLLGVLEDRRFLAVPVVVTAFMLQHALQGWCPPLPVIRRMGVRTAREIEQERVALKALRGDFAAMERPAEAPERAARALAAA